MECHKCGKRAAKVYVHRRVGGHWKHVGYYCKSCGHLQRAW